MTVPLCALSLALTSCPVSPVYWGWVGHTRPPLVHVIQYITFVDKQSNFDKFVVEHNTDLANLGEFLHKLQFLLQCLKPNLSLTECLFITALDNFALTKNSQMF